MTAAPGPTWLDIALWCGSVYGLSWLVTRSSLLRPAREKLLGVRFVGHLSQCIVCVSAWASIALLALLPRTRLFSPAFRAAGLADGVVLVLLSVAVTWAVGRALGDAD